MRKSHYEVKTKHYRHLDGVIEKIFVAADEADLGLHQLAEKAGVCIKTIENLCLRKTMFPRYKTIWSLADAVGLQLVLPIQMAPKKQKLRIVG